MEKKNLLQKQKHKHIMTETKRNFERDIKTVICFLHKIGY